MRFNSASPIELHWEEEARAFEIAGAPYVIAARRRSLVACNFSGAAAKALQLLDSGALSVKFVVPWFPS